MAWEKQIIMRSTGLGNVVLILSLLIAFVCGNKSVAGLTNCVWQRIFSELICIMRQRAQDNQCLTLIRLINY